MFGIWRHIAPLLLRLGLALGVVMLGFAHGPLHSRGAAWAAYAMPDGTLPQLCSTDSGPPHSLNEGHCPACHLVAQVPGPTAQPKAPWTLNPTAAPLHDKAQVLGHIHPNARPEARAPPTQTV